MLKIENLRFSYNNKIILNNISLDICFGNITCLVGKSGAGKTTLLQCIAQLKQSYIGKISIENKDLKSLALKDRTSYIGFVFQDFCLFENLTVLQNCIQPLMLVKKLSKEEAISHITRMLEKFGLSGLENSYSDQLSGGQKQRVAIVRALALNPKIILLDEPTSALDSDNSRNLELILTELRQQGVTLIISSHDMGFVNNIADKIVYIEKDNESLKT